MSNLTPVHEGAEATVSAIKATAVTKSDSTVLDLTRALYVGSGGDIVVTMYNGSDATFVGVPTGTILPIQVTKVKAATTAASILALY